MNLDVVPVTALVVGALTLALLLADAVTAVIDARRVRDEDEPDSLTRGRIRQLAWAVAITAALAVLVAFGVDSAARLIWVGASPAAGAFVLLTSAAGAFLVGLVAVVAIVRRERPSYARIRRDLRDRDTVRLEPGELEEFERRFERADRVRGRRDGTRVALRVIGLIVVLLADVVLAVTDRSWIALAAVSAALAIAAFVVALRAGAVRARALAAVLDTQRAEVAALLERARIPQRGRTPGLRDRVSRALAILREQQAPRK